MRAFLGIETFRPLFAHVARHNAGSIRVLEKCGFVFIRQETISDQRGQGIDELLVELEA